MIDVCFANLHCIPGVGISVAKAREASVSMIRLTHSICTACKLIFYSVANLLFVNSNTLQTFNGESCIAHAPMNATITATTLTVNWNCKNLAILSYTFLPHITAFTMLLKLSSVNMISEASFATSVPAIPF